MGKDDHYIEKVLQENLGVSDFIQREPALVLTLFNEEDQLPLVPNLLPAGFGKHFIINLNLSREDPGLIEARIFMTKRPCSDFYLFEGKREFTYFDTEKENGNDLRYLKIYMNFHLIYID